MRTEGKKVKSWFGSGGIRTHAPEETGALNQRLRPLGHATFLLSLLEAGALVPVAGHFFTAWPQQPSSNVYGHITLKTPVLVRSLKSSNVEPR